MNKSKIIRVEPTTPMISLTWMIGSRCNYDCMYCPTELHDKTSTHPDLEKLKMVWQSFYEKTKHIGLPYKISFTGGEVTANKSFLPLMTYLKTENFNIGQMLMGTNGSASLSYYKKLAEWVDAISFSTHSEFINEKLFFDKALKINQIMIRPQKSFHINIMDESWNQERIKLYCVWCEKNSISYSVNNLVYERGTRTYPIMQGTYNLEQV